MKNKVIEFLGNPPKSKPEQFNQALSLYKDSKNNNPSQVRYMNTLGFSADRLESLLYDLKKLHNIRDVEVANHRNAKAAEVAKAAEEQTPAPIEYTDEQLAEVKANVLAFDLEGVPEEELIEAANQLREIFTIDPLQDPGTPIGVITLLQAQFAAELEVKGEGDGSPKTEDGSPKTEVRSEEEEAIDKVKEDLKTELEKVLDNPEKTESAGSAESAGEKETEVQGDPSDEFLKSLAVFDVEAAKYQHLKAFAAVVSDVMGEEAENQKGDTLKAFVLAAKKKYPAA